MPRENSGIQIFTLSNLITVFWLACFNILHLFLSAFYWWTLFLEANESCDSALMRLDFQLNSTSSIYLTHFFLPFYISSSIFLYCCKEYTHSLTLLSHNTSKYFSYLLAVAKAKLYNMKQCC